MPEAPTGSHLSIGLQCLCVLFGCNSPEVMHESGILLFVDLL